MATKRRYGPEATCEQCGNSFRSWHRTKNPSEGRFCSLRCFHTNPTAAHRGSKKGKFQPSRPLADRFWERVAVVEEGCWEWIGRFNHKGYGVLDNGTGSGNRPVVASRIAWEVVNGPIPTGMSVCHHCDNPACVRPDHLFVGTQQDNARDMVAKGRNKPSFVHGVDLPQAKLNESMVREARELHATGTITQRKLGAMFGVSQRVVMNAVRGVTWKHVN